MPVYNEYEILPRLHREISNECVGLGESFEILFVDDGSDDGSSDVLDALANEDSSVSVCHLSRNFGHPAALHAALDLARGEILILMDADLQDDPKLIPKLVEVHREQQADVVYVVRRRRKESLLMRIFFLVFHLVMSKASTYPVPRDSGSFGLVGGQALPEIRRLSERLRYFPGLRSFVGFKQVPLEAERGRRYDDSSRVGFRGLVRLAGLAFFSQSRAPVRVFYWFGGLGILSAILLAVYALVGKIIGYAVVAWASTITTLAFFSSIIILGQALIAEYLSRIYEEVRSRPSYIIKTFRPCRVPGAPASHHVAGEEKEERYPY